MESYAAKVLFSAPCGEETPEATIQTERVGPQLPFTCPFCGELYQVSAELAGKKLNAATFAMNYTAWTSVQKQARGARRAYLLRSSGLVLRWPGTLFHSHRPGHRPCSKVLSLLPQTFPSRLSSLFGDVWLRYCGIDPPEALMRRLPIVFALVGMAAVHSLCMSPTNQRLIPPAMRPASKQAGKKDFGG